MCSSVLELHLTCGSSQTQITQCDTTTGGGKGTGWAARCVSLVVFGACRKALIDLILIGDELFLR